jgi:hypothetical protein
MSDYSEILNRIATSLNVLANAPSYIFVTPIAIFVSALIGWVASQYTIRKQEEIRNIELVKRRSLVFRLIQDEINLRWRGEIELYLRKLEDLDSLTALQHLSRMELNGDDTYILKTVSQSFSEYHFLEDHNLVSEIVHGYLLICDFSDYRNIVEKLIQEYKKKQEKYKQSISVEERNKMLNDEFSKEIDYRFCQLKEKLNNIDARFKTIINGIETRNSE